MDKETEGLIVVTVLGRDCPGLVAKVSGRIAELGVNIVDIEQTLIRGLFSMFMLADLASANLEREEFARIMSELSEELGVEIKITSYSKYDGELHPPKKNLHRVTVMGRDKPGIIAAISNTLYEDNVNIEGIKMIARGDLLVTEMSIDIRDKQLQHIRTRLRETGEGVGMDIVVQPENLARARRHLVVFDMDSTIVDAEIIDELAKVKGVGEKVADITSRGMQGQMDFKESLRERVRLLEGLPVSTLEEIRDNMKLTPGTEDLIRALKKMNFKLALVSGGFTYFTEELKNRLGFDYAYGNKLVIKDGKLTGEVEGDIIDSERKAAIVREIMEKEGLTRDEVVAVGDGANDQVMIQTAGLGIAFNAKDVLKKVADGSVTKDNLKGLIYLFRN